MTDNSGTRRAKEILIPFDPDEMEGCHSCKHNENFNTEKEPCKSCYGLSKYTKKEEKCECDTCIYAPNNECGWYAACNNCIDGSNYWRRNNEQKDT
jgi:hypothetical protein